MLKKLLFLFLTTLTITGQAQQSTGAIKGKIIDRDSKQPLWGVNIILVNSNPPQGATTNEDGTFRITDVGVGRHTIKFTYVGYDDMTVPELLVNSGRETELNLEMTEKVTAMKEVVVTAEHDKAKANNDFAAVSARSFSAEEMNRYAGTLNDPARMAQSFAGVMTANDENNQIVVRGNSPRGLLWRMEGIEIPNPNHFAGSEGSTGGGVSILSSNMLTNTDFYSGAFPGEFGNALSGVFDLNLRKGNADKREFTFQAGILGLEAALEGPWSYKYKGSYLVNYRYSTLDILSLMGFKIGGNVLPKYQDLSFNLYFPTKKAGNLTLFGLGGLSGLGEKAKTDSTLWKTLSDKSQYNQAQKVGVIGLTHLYLFKDNKTYLKSVVSYSYTRNSYTEDTLSDALKPTAISDERFTYQAFRGTMILNTKLDARNTIRAGIVYTHTRYGLYSQSFNYFLQQQQLNVNDKGSTNLYQAYAQWKHRFSPNFQINTGVHFTYSDINDKFYIEPRASAEWALPNNQTISFGTGLHSRIDAMSTYVSYTTTNPANTHPNRKLDFSRALHAVVGYNFGFKRDFRLKLEAYAQYLFSVPVGADSMNTAFSILNYDDGFVNMPMVSKGTGINYGLEITLEKFFSHGYYFMFTTSLFDSRYKALDNQWRSTAYNVNYVMNALGGKEFIIGKRKNNIIAINAKIVWRGGQRITPINLQESILEGQTVYKTESSFSEKLPDYFRIDFGASFRRNKKKYSWIFSFDAQNLINCENVARKIYNPQTQQIEIRRNLGILPVFSWKIQFSTK
ncbi:MAG: TonB-dependent receptor [Chitinophagales bacterium]